MDGAAFVDELKNGSGPETKPENNVFDELWSDYERIVLNSLVTSFGLDFLVRDQHGGDVDTIHNVRQIGSDLEMGYKNLHNKEKYDTREQYDKSVGNAYRSDEKYKERVKLSKKEFNEKGKMIPDAYVPGNTLIPKKNKTIPIERQGQLDHVISIHEIHDDPGRILAGIDGIELANKPSNLQYTNAELNIKKSDKRIDELLSCAKENTNNSDNGSRRCNVFTKAVEQRMRNADKRAREAYDSELIRKYYTSPDFARDAAIAVKKRAFEMGIRQALGFVFVEIWLCAKENLQRVPSESDFEDMLNAVGHGIKSGLDNARVKYKEVFAKMGEGLTSGALASLTTTLSNIFFTTAKNLVRYIRQIYASVVQAGKVLFINPDNLLYGDRIKTTTIILASGASVLAGTVAGDLISKTPIGVMPEIGSIATTFCSTMISGLLSCTFLVFLDRSRFINELVDTMNKIPSIVTDYREIANAMDLFAAKIANLDIEKFRQDTERFAKVADDIFVSEDEDAINGILYDAYEKLGIKIPWEGDFDSFMGNKNNRLVFG